MSNDQKIEWKKSSFCITQCVEVAKIEGKIAIRDSKNTSGGLFLFTQDEWSAFIKGVKNGEFE